MPRFTYDTDKSPEETFGVPCGSYVATFLGTEDRPPFDGPSRFGKERTDEPRLAWMFEVVTPAELRGRKFTQGSGSRASGPRARFTQMLKGLLGRLPQKGETINTDDYRGRQYRVEIEVNPDSEAGNFYIAFMTPASAGTAPPASAPAAPPPSAPRPPAPSRPVGPVSPPPPKSSAHIPPAVDRDFWLDDDGTVSQVKESFVRGLITEKGFKPEAIKLMNLDKSGGWVTAKDLRLDEPF